MCHTLYAELKKFLHLEDTFKFERYKNMMRKKICNTYKFSNLIRSVVSDSSWCFSKWKSTTNWIYFNSVRTAILRYKLNLREVALEVTAAIHLECVPHPFHLGWGGIHGASRWHQEVNSQGRWIHPNTRFDPWATNPRPWFKRHWPIQKHLMLPSCTHSPRSKFYWTQWSLLLNKHAFEVSWRMGRVSCPRIKHGLRKFLCRGERTKGPVAH